MSPRAELGTYVSKDEMNIILNASNPAARILHLQSVELKPLLDAGTLSVQSYGEMLKTLRDLHDQQARCERIKDSPYPRQYAVVSALFDSIFCILLPFGLIGQLGQLDAEIGGLLKGHMVWLVVPFSVIIG